MGYKVFISHSITPADQAIVYGIAQHLAERQIEPYIAERDWQFGKSLAVKVEQAIEGCDCVLALLTIGGSKSAYVNQEIGYALGKGKLVVPIVEKGVDVRGLQAGVEYVELQRGNTTQCVLTVGHYLERIKAGKEAKDAVGLAALAVLLWLATKS